MLIQAIFFLSNFLLKDSYKEDIDPHSGSKIANQLATELQTFMSIYKKNFSMLKSFKNATIISIESLRVIP